MAEPRGFGLTFMDLGPLMGEVLSDLLAKRPENRMRDPWGMHLEKKHPPKLSTDPPWSIAPAPSSPPISFLQAG